jgi:hypothetical protein
MKFWPAVVAAATTLLFGGSILVRAGVARPVSAAASASALPGAQPFATPMVPDVGAQPPTTAQCQAEYGLACYSPQQLQTAYDMASLYASGEDGVGETIVLVDSERRARPPRSLPGSWRSPIRRPGTTSVT